MEQREYTDEQIRSHFFNLYDQMPEDYAILAKLRYDDEWAMVGVECARIMPTKLSIALYLGIEWDKAPEDRNFWIGVCNVIRGTALCYPAIPESFMREIEQFKSKRDALPAEHSPVYISISPEEYEQLIEPGDFQQFNLLEPELPFFDWNQDLRRKPNEEIFIGPRLLLPVRPLKSDKLLMRGVYVEEEIFHKHNVLSIKLKDRGAYVETYLPYLGILNSQLIGFLFFHLSSQWGKGEGKRDTLRNIDIERLPIKRISDQTCKDEVTNLVKTIQIKKAKKEDCSAEIDQINEMVFDLYDLVDYEKEIIREFFDVRVNRSGKRESLVRSDDMAAYFEAFKSAFSLLLAGNQSLNATFEISSNIGAVICFAVVEKSDESALERNETLNLLRFVKQNQLSKADALKVLFEEKVKIYDKDAGAFFIIKSNRFKDWTVRQAIKDAKEEVDAIMEVLK